jgi:hypothetical protein
MATEDISGTPLPDYDGSRGIHSPAIFSLRRTQRYGRSMAMLPDLPTSTARHFRVLGAVVTKHSSRDRGNLIIVEDSGGSMGAPLG